jgi:GTPase SAR1 family protein
MDKKTLEKKLHKQLKEWQPIIEQFKAQAIKTSDEVREAFLALLDDYKAKEKELLDKLEVIKHESEGAFKDLQVGLKKVSKDMAKTFEKMSSHFSNKVT